MKILTDDYQETTQNFIDLCDEIMEEEETDWYREDENAYSLDCLIVGAFWHYTEWHGGQDSIEYQALSALGKIFDPNMSMPETDNLIYQQLNAMAEAEE